MTAKVIGSTFMPRQSPRTMQPIASAVRAGVRRHDDGGVELFDDQRARAGATLPSAPRLTIATATRGFAAGKGDVPRRRLATPPRAGAIFMLAEIQPVVAQAASPTTRSFISSIGVASR